MVTKEQRLLEQQRKGLAMAQAAKQALVDLRRSQDRQRRAEERKARTRALIAYGGLMEIAGLIGADRGMVLGLLLWGRRAVEEEGDQAAAWKRAGDAELARREGRKGAGRGEVPLVDAAQAGDVRSVPVSVPIPTGEADGAQQALESLMERLDYGSQGRTAADRQSVAALVERFGAQQVDNNIAALRAQGGKVYPSTLWKRMTGSAQETRQP